MRLHSEKLEHSRSSVGDVGERVPRIGYILEENKDEANEVNFDHKRSNKNQPNHSQKYDGSNDSNRFEHQLELCLEADQEPRSGQGD